MGEGGWGCLGVVQLGWGYWEEGGWGCLGVVPLGWGCLGEGRELHGSKTSRQQGTDAQHTGVSGGAVQPGGGTTLQYYTEVSDAASMLTVPQARKQLCVPQGYCC